MSSQAIIVPVATWTSRTVVPILFTPLGIRSHSLSRELVSARELGLGAGTAPGR